MPASDETELDRRLLAEASEILAATIDPCPILERFVDLVARSFAETSAVYSPGPSGAELSAEAHRDARCWQWRTALGAESPIARVLETGAAELYVDAASAELASVVRWPDGAPTPERSAMFVPLAGRSRVLAVMAFVSPRARRYDERDLAMAVDLARLAALAVENARLYESERRAREAAERLQRLTAALAKVVSAEQAAATIAHEARAALGAGVAGVWLLTSDGDALELVARDGRDLSDTCFAGEHVALSDGGPLAEALTRAELVVCGPDGGSLAWVVLPIETGERPLGALALGFSDPVELPLEERALMLSMARQCAWAVERVQLFAAENQARAELAETNRTLAALIEASPAGILLLELDGTVRLWNGGAERTFGWEALEAVGRDVRALALDVLDDPLSRIALGEPALGLETRGTRRDGARVDVALWAVPVARPLREPLCLVVIIDITDRTQAEEAAREASRRKDEFLAMLGHELRNPLAPILTALELMKTDDGASAVEARRVIERQAKHLVRLVDDLLDLSRITRGKVELALEDVEIAEVFRVAIEMTSPLLEQQAHELIVEAPRRGLAVRADPVRLAQVLQNLLSNSAKYTPPRGRILLRAHRDGEQVVVAVEDDGPGIAPELLPHLFEPFVQGARTIDRAQGGLGIGLTLVHSLVSLHGGEVTAKSDGIGSGTLMIVRLPAARPSLMPSPPADPAAHALPMVSSGRRVLVVDDNPDAAEMLAILLRRRGHDAVVAHDGPSALELYERFRPDAALLDIGLPVMDGYELATRLRARSAGSLLLVAVTGYGQDTDRQRSQEAGFAHHLVKPVNTKQLLSILAPQDPF